MLKIIPNTPAAHILKLYEHRFNPMKLKHKNTDVVENNSTRS